MADEAAPLFGGVAWRRYIRDTLEDLQRRLEEGELDVNLTYDGGGAWPVIRGRLIDGREIIMPFGKGALCPPPPLERSPKNLLLPWTLRDEDGDAQVNIPRWAVARDKGWLVDLRPAARSRNGVEHGHGWPALGLGFAHGVTYKQTPFLHPGAIIVLQVREGHDDVDYGWYVRTRNTKELVRVPAAACTALTYMMRTDPVYRDLELLESAHKVGAERNYLPRFHPLAVATYSGYRNRIKAVTQQAKQAKKRSREEAAPSASCDTCVVCLEERETTQARCHAGTCSAKMCATCHSDSRGLCPICDRGPINAVYPCERCFQLTPLREYGYQCINCDSLTLCKACYTGYRECCSCESLA